MPHYFLHIRDGDERLDDPEGGDFDNLAGAKDEALQGARELISECVRVGSPMRLHRVFEIADPEGRIFATVPFADAIDRG